MGTVCSKCGTPVGGFRKPYRLKCKKCGGWFCPSHFVYQRKAAKFEAEEKRKELDAQQRQRPVDLYGEPGHSPMSEDAKEALSRTLKVEMCVDCNRAYILQKADQLVRAARDSDAADLYEAGEFWDEAGRLRRGKDPRQV